MPGAVTQIGKPKSRMLRSSCLPNRVQSVDSSTTATPRAFPVHATEAMSSKGMEIR
jgi:hypothetical protein